MGNYSRSNIIFVLDAAHFAAAPEVQRNMDCSVPELTMASEIEIALRQQQF